MKISVQLEALTGSFETDMKRASRTAQKELEALQKQAIAAGKVIGTALVAGAGALAAIVNSNLKTIASYQDLADQVGDTASQISSLKPAADLSETAMEQVAAASVKLTAGLSKTSEESKGVGKALAAIGIELEAFRKLAPVAQLDAVAKALNNFEDGASKTAVAVTLFGKSGAELMPFLKDLGEQTERNVTLTEEQIAAADEYTKTIARMKGEVSSVTQEFSARLAPTMQLIAKRFGESLNQSGFLNDTLRLLEKTLKSLVGAGVVVATVFEFLQKSLGGVAAAIVTAVQGDFSAAAKILSETGKDIRSDFADSSRFIADMFASANSALAETASATDQATRSTINYSAATEKAEKSVKKQTDTLKEFNRELEKYNDLLVTEEDQALEPARRRGEIRQSVMNPSERLRERLKELNDPELDLRNKDFETYRRAIAEAQEEFARAVDSIGQGMEKIETDSKDAWSQFKDFAAEAAQTAEDAFAQFLFDPFENGVKGMLASFGDMLRQMAAQALANQIFQGVMNFAAGAFGGGSYAALDIPIDGARANGGPVSAGGTYLVGEKGPELFVPNTSGSIMPNAKSAYSITINQTIQAPTAAIGQKTALQAGVDAGRYVSGAMKRNG